MRIFKNIIIDIAAIIVVLLLNFVITTFTDLLLSDILFWEFATALIVAAFTMGLSRREIRKAARKLDKKEKEKSRRAFRTSEKVSFNFAFVAIVFFALSLYFVPK